MITTFNTTSLQYGTSFPQPVESDFPSTCFKYAPFEVAFNNTTPYVQKILSVFKPKMNNRLLVDIKVHSLVRGQYACIPGWHYDSQFNLDRLVVENYHLFVSGQHALTEFMTEIVSITGTTIHDVKESLKDTYKSLIVPSATIVSYTSLNLHRSTQSTGNEKRLLVRVVESTTIPSSSKPFYPTTY